MPLLTPRRVGHGPYSGGASGGSSGEEPPVDCLVAKAVNKELKPSVDCFYSWEHWHEDNFLFYVIRITPTGQNSEGWAKGVRDNIKGEVNSKSCETETSSGIRSNLQRSVAPAILTTSMRIGGTTSTRTLASRARSTAPRSTASR